MTKTQSIFSLVELEILVAQERSKDCNGGEISNSFALGCSTTGLAYFIDRLDLSKKQMKILEAEFASLENQYNMLTKKVDKTI